MPRIRSKAISQIVFSFLTLATACTARTVLVEAERFDSCGGWVLDQQFMDQMGSPYLLAHGLGTPVADAETTIEFPAPGRYRVWVRTRNWVAQWQVPGAPGRFRVIVDGQKLETVFGTERVDWHWQNGGTIEIENRRADVVLHDLTGFEGRCDAIAFCSDLDFEPPNDGDAMDQWRRRICDLPEEPLDAGHYDLVVSGGGIAGVCASLNAARLGLKVALIQDRPVLGGNNSSEVRVWLHGQTRFEPYPRIGEVVAELEPARRAHYGPENKAELYEDQRRIDLVKDQKNLSLFLRHRANGVEVAYSRISAVIAEDIVTGQRKRFSGKLFADCTGDGCIGFLAGADFDMTLDGHMGRCNLWNVVDTGKPQPFPHCPWAVDLYGKPFPTDLKQLGAWFWEAGFYHDPFEKSEHIRDLNFRAMYGAWDALKNDRNMYRNYKLNWAAYISGKRESRRLLGDVVLTKSDIINGVEYPDGCVPTTWKIDLHLPNPGYDDGFEGDEFISRADFTSYKTPYWLPYRCLYSRNISNLFMAGRDISVTHEALGAVRVMRTCGMMGEIVGMASSICVNQDVTPRQVYEDHLDELIKLMKKGSRPNPAEKAGPNLALDANLKVSGSLDDQTYPLQHINDGKADLGDNSTRWLSSDSETQSWVEFTWPQPRKIAALRITSGYRGGSRTDSAISDFHLQTFEEGAWRKIEATEVIGNASVDRFGKFPPIQTDRLRLVVTKTHMNIARIWEIALFGP